MAWGAESGPVVGASLVQTFHVPTWTASGTTLPYAIFTFPQDGRLLALRIRTTGLVMSTGAAATGTITAYLVRAAVSGATAVTASGTQVLGADGGAIAANAEVVINPEGTSATLLSLRQFTQGDQIGFFATTDAGTLNGVTFTVAWYPHTAAGVAAGGVAGPFTGSKQTKGGGQVRTVDETD